ncbi:MAG: SCP2 sterol-binding domain-containing protein [Ghiorsea sp.]|nr:SCP2 sterol-binding domain-containing protein [Ghiorsea sp.]
MGAPIFRATTRCKIESTVTGFARLSFAKEDPDALVMQKVLKLSGDSQAMLLFQKLLHELDLDWELELRRTFGDFFGRKVAKAAYGLIDAEKKLREQSTKLIDQALRGMDTPSAENLQLWQAGVESVSRKVNKLQRQLDKLEHAVQQQTKREGMIFKGLRRNIRLLYIIHVLATHGLAAVAVRLRLFSPYIWFISLFSSEYKPKELGVQIRLALERLDL